MEHRRRLTRKSPEPFHWPPPLMLNEVIGGVTIKSKEEMYFSATHNFTTATNGKSHQNNSSQSEETCYLLTMLDTQRKWWVRGPAYVSALTVKKYWEDGLREQVKTESCPLYFGLTRNIANRMSRLSTASLLDNANKVINERGLTNPYSVNKEPEASNRLPSVAIRLRESRCTYWCTIRATVPYDDRQLRFRVKTGREPISPPQ